MSALSVRARGRGGSRLRVRRPTRHVQRRVVKRTRRVTTRRYGRTATQVRRRRRQQIPGTGMEYSKVSRQYGRFGRRNVRQAFKELRSAQTKLILRYQGMNPFGANGFFWMNNIVVGGRRMLPCYAVNLTSGPQYSYSAQPMLQYSMDTATDKYQWVPTAGQDPNGGASFGWNTEDNNTAGSSVLGSRTLLKWISVKMNCYGCVAKPTKWLIQVIQLKDDELDPWRFNAEPALTGGAEHAAVFWQNMIKKYTFNPIATVGREHARHYKVLKSVSFIQDPQLTIDADQAPKCKEVNLFAKQNQMCKWDQIKTKLATIADVIDTADYTAENVAGQVNGYLDTKYSKILLIRALNAGIDDATSTLATPSFDLNIRTCHVKM